MPFFFPLLLSFLSFCSPYPLFFLTHSHSLYFSPIHFLLILTSSLPSPFLSSWPMLPFLCCLSLSHFLFLQPCACSFSCPCACFLTHVISSLCLTLSCTLFLVCFSHMLSLANIHSSRMLLLSCSLLATLVRLYSLSFLSAPPYCSFAPFHVPSLFFLHPHSFSCCHSPSHVLAVFHTHTLNLTHSCSHGITPFLAPLCSPFLMQAFSLIPFLLLAFSQVLPSHCSFLSLFLCFSLPCSFSLLLPLLTLS